jgi:hypothetical protein
MSTKKEKTPGDVFVNIRMSTEYKKWLEKLADHCRLDISKTVDKGLVLLAKSENFEKAPRR